jgi:hypothetical protein
MAYPRGPAEHRACQGRGLAGLSRGAQGSRRGHGTPAAIRDRHVELAQIAAALATGTVPELIERSDGAGNFVYVLDLGVVVPLSLLAASWLRRRSAWGDVLAGVLLVKAATMGLALLSMTWFSWRAGQPVEVGLTAAYTAIAAGGLAMSAWFFNHCR